ncbi:hypothetical protein Tco_0073966 [Tanacetum coccineum]
MDELHRAVAPFIHSSGGGLPGGSMGHGGGGSAPFDVGFFAGNENADPADMGAAEQHQNIARREWDELRSSREWRSVENHFARCDRKIDAIFEKARSMYRDGHLALDIEDESDIKRGLDAYFSDLHDFPSNGHRFRRLKLVAGNATNQQEMPLEVIVRKEYDNCASRGEPASSRVAFRPKHTTAIAISSIPFLVHKAECSLKPVHSREKPVQGLARAVEEDDYLKPLFQADVDSTESAYAKQSKGVLNKVLLLPSLTLKGKGVKLNASLAHSERISALVEMDEAGPSPSLEISCFEMGLAREQGASLPLSERPIEREAVNQLSGLGLLVSEGCFGKAYERISFDGRSVAGREELIPGVKDGSSSSSALLAASSQLSSKRWFARAIVRISSTMSTESSTRNHFFDILEKIKQFRVSKLMVVTVGSSPKCIKTLGSTIPRPALGCVKPRADTNKSVPLIPPNTEPPKGRPVPKSKIGLIVQVVKEAWLDSKGVVKLDSSSSKGVVKLWQEEKSSLLASLFDSCASRGELASSGVAFHPKHTTAIVECSLKPVHSREKPVQGLARAVEEDDYLKPIFQVISICKEKQRGLKASGNKVKLLPEDESFSSAVNAIIIEAQAVARLTSQIASSPPRKKNQRSQVPWASSKVSSQSCAF